MISGFGFDGSGVDGVVDGVDGVEDGMEDGVEDGVDELGFWSRVHLPTPINPKTLNPRKTYI